MTPVKEPSLQLQTAPFLASQVTTPRVMYDVIAALIPATFAAVYYFGLGAILVILASIAGCVFTEWLFNRKAFQLRDGTLILTGILLALTLPPGFPLWMAFVGGVVSIGLGRLIWGGLGQNPFNPALVGRAFLQAAFPTAITTFRAPGTLSTFFDVDKSTFAAPLMKSEVVEPPIQLTSACFRRILEEMPTSGDSAAAVTAPSVDAVSTATPLKEMWQSTADTAKSYAGPDFQDLFIGNVSGSLGETAGVLLILGGLYMLWRRAFDWRIPVSIFVAVGLFSAIYHAVSPGHCPSPQFMLASGGLILGAVFMATDPVSSPMAPLGAWIYGIGIGVLVVLIRVDAALPEGVMYAILFMNAFTPLIDRAVKPTPLGRRFFGKGAAK